MSPFPSQGLVPWLGMYGVGFLLMALAATFPFVKGKTVGSKWVWTALLAIAIGAGQFASSRHSALSPQTRPLHVAGVQLEMVDPQYVLNALDKLIAKSPEADLLVLSEYTFDGRVPSLITDWCDLHDKYLIAGGKEYLDSGESQFGNTAFVIGPDGKELFAQAKKVPIQFFKDGLPASRQAVWDSPWGKIGLCVCYDLSYTRVTDELIRQGAQAIIVPTMDVQEWGERQHRLHARVAPTRAAEYGVPIFRLCSSGVSQAVSGRGRVFASAGYPGQGETIAATVQLEPGKRRLPFDRYLVWPCLFVCVWVLAWHVVDSFGRGKRIQPPARKD